MPRASEEALRAEEAALEAEIAGLDLDTTGKVQRRLNITKKYEEAIDDFDKAISLDDNYAKAYLNRGVSKQMTRDEDGACSDWYKAKELGIMMVKKYLANDCE